MKINSTYMKQLFCTLLLLICCQYMAFSQETNSGIRNRQGIFYGFSGGPSRTKITNSGSVFESNLVTGKENSYFGNAEIGYFFSDYFGLSTGIGYISYKTKLSLKSFQKNFFTVDSENESFEMRVSGSDIQELQTVNFLNIPFNAHFRLPFNSSFGIFLKAGINLSLPISKKHNSTGTFSYKGYYPAYNVLLENLPQYGFINDTIIKSNGDMEINKLHFNTLVSAGFDVNITPSMQIALAVNFSNSLLKESSPSNEATLSPDKFELAPDTKHINSFLDGSSKATAQSMGFEITIRFFLK